MRKILIVFLLYVSVQGYAQTISGDFDLANYPEMSFVWNEYNPELMDSTQFILSANSERISFSLQGIAPINPIAKPKTILFLWEDLNHKDRKGQDEFTKQVLSDFLKEAASQTEDKFNVAIFDRKGGNDVGSSIHTLLSNEFTSDCSQLADKVLTFSHKYDFFSNQVNSELYLAMEEGLELLEKEPADRVRIMVVITAGSNQGYYGGKGDFDAMKAVGMRIPIYLVKYPIPHCEHCSNINQISKSSYGQQVETQNVSVAKELLLESYKKMSNRHYGQDYRISFTANFSRDGKPHALLWNVNGKEYPLSFTTPSFSLTIWAKEHIVWSILLGLGLLLIVTLILFFILHVIKKRKKEILDIKAKQKTIQQEADADKIALKESRQQAADQERLAKEQQREKYFGELMQTKNLFPRLQLTDNGSDKSYTIHKPETTIGRDDDNDFILLSDSVSRHHAKVIFNGSGFEIHDLESTNKVIVNGSFVQQVLLTAGDIIELGEVVIYFYK